MAVHGGPSRALGVAIAVALAVPATAAAATFPLADGRVSTTTPRVGWAFGCEPPARAAAAPRPWIARGRWDPGRMPTVDGTVAWPGASFGLSAAGGWVTFRGSGLPLGSLTGSFPPGPGDDAAPYATAVALAEADVAGRFRARPRVGRRARCVAAGAPVGVARDGVPILPPFDAAGLDAGAREVTDRCGGGPDPSGVYHYRRPRCLGGASRAHSPLVGWARDGHGIYGPRGARGRPLRSAHLDACHGHAHAVTVGGRREQAYHYHLTPDFPYAVGCFRGSPRGGWRIARRSAPGGGGPGGGSGPEPTPDTSLTPSPDTRSGPESELPPEPDGPPRILSDPELIPGFDPAITDYAVRCVPDTPLEVTVDAPARNSVSVDGAPARDGRFTRAVLLAQNQAFRIHVTTPRTRRDYHVRCLPAPFPVWEAERLGQPQAQWYVATPGAFTGRFVIVFDAHGVPVWWFDNVRVPIDAKLRPGGDLAWFDGADAPFGDDPNLGYKQRRLDGSLVREIRTVGTPTDIHDLQRTADGHELLMSYRLREHADLTPIGGPADARVFDAEFQELDESGALVWSWNSKDHLPVAESERWKDTILGQPLDVPGGPVYDIVHPNSIEVDGGGVIVSMRHTDSVYRIDRASGAVSWKLGGTPRTESLAIVGAADPLAGARFGGQHDPRVLPDGTLTLFDNGSTRDRPPEALRYRIDTVARTATLLESVTDPVVGGSFCCGSARKLSGGNWVVAWGGTRYASELTPAAQPVLRFDFGIGLFSYRIDPIEPGRIDAGALRAGMDAMHPRG